MKISTAMVIAITVVVFISCNSSKLIAQDIGQTAAKQEILETVYLYSYYWDSKDAEKLAQLFTENAIWEWFPRGAEKPRFFAANRNEFKKFASDRFKTNLADRQTWHYMTNTVFLELTNNFARTKTMVILFHEIKGEKRPQAMGSSVITHELVKTKDGWKINRHTRR